MMKKLILSGFIVLIAAAFSINYENSVIVINPENYNKVYKAVDSVRHALEIASGKLIPSLNVLIQTPSDIIFVSTIPSNGTQITKDTYFRFASNSKNFTATAILNMYEDGWLDIYDKITDTIPGSNMTYVPSIPEWNIPNKNQITIEQLLQHSAGVFDLGNDTIAGLGGNTYYSYVMGIDPEHQFTATELANQLTIHNLFYFQPGTNYHYSNTGYTILSEIISRVYSFRKSSTKLFSDYLYDYIIGSSSPVQISAKFPYLATDKQMPAPYIPSRTYNPDGSITYSSEENMSAFVAEGNGIGTMYQLNTYIRSLMQGRNVLNPATVELMKNSISPGSNTYALGCSRLPNLGFGHTGATHGYFSIMIYDPETTVSVIGMLPSWDLSNGSTSLFVGYYAMIDACYAARSALGFPGKP